LNHLAGNRQSSHLLRNTALRGALIAVLRPLQAEKEAFAMAQAIYSISQTGGGWIISHDGEVSPPYEMLESAFEAACAAASLALKQGLDATLTVDQTGSGASAIERRPLGEALVHPEAGRSV
jgi:hypothetical protein